MLRCTQLVGFDWLNSAAAASATATATATGTAPTVTAVGTNTNNTSSSTITFTVPAGGIPANSVIIVCASSQSLNTVTAGSDTKGNTYQLGVQKSFDGTGAGGHKYLGGLVFSQNSSALVSGDVITATFSASNSGRAILVAYATGLTTGTLLDKSSSSSGTTGAMSSGATAVTSAASELAVGFSVSDASLSVTESSGYTQIYETSIGGNLRTHLAYKVLSSTGAQTYAPSTGGGLGYVCAVQTLLT